eukprot:CAMPEP_0183302622 /NCGR_PEP_ID=MMETSP0160_2-20130417/8337_1 /TAXON_ID=2839 ORGANISM="Odontella Sinensis, Strain Grunow 1884" /NCGR_SAMPLE_ID=MMETSP0160_2 /ASSEMBLY_ACC=CAM_ASM_000250 /LENGTH=239 /DNA_ID=CAMNT_0025465413 /DNA_START=151 /DNA_END=872 /DNA_ORIENTATION=-
MEEDEESPYIVEDRMMLSRASGDAIRITHTIEPGRRTAGCLTCCHAPPRCPVLRFLPCVDPPEYVVLDMNASRYVYVRENGIEWNDPSYQPGPGDCCGGSCSTFAVMDDVTVLHFDDVRFTDVGTGRGRATTRSRSAAEGRERWCGSSGGGSASGAAFGRRRGRAAAAAAGGPDPVGAAAAAARARRRAAAAAAADLERHLGGGRRGCRRDHTAGQGRSAQEARHPTDANGGKRRGRTT